jgi:hypothetical protein
MYEMMFPGANPELAANILSKLGLPRHVRTRDAWIEPGPDGDPILRILTRAGGGNRFAYIAQITQIKAHPLYLFDHDEAAWDSTYASFYFRVPEFLPKFTADMITEEKSVSMKERANAALEAASKRWERGEFTEAEQRIRDQLTGLIDGTTTRGIIEI